MNAETLQKLSLSDFSYDFPQDLVAQQPLTSRDSSRLLVHRKGISPDHAFVNQLPDLLPPNTVLVVNETKVFASRIYGRLASGAAIEVFLLEKPVEQKDFLRASCLVRPGRKLQEGTAIFFAENIEARVAYKPEKGDPSPYLIDFMKVQDFSSWLQRHAFVPLPPYIKREAPLPWQRSEDTERYQTVYAHHEGSVAAPTAGLHFTPELLAALRARDIQVVPVTLHVSAGTFLPVKNEDVSQHKMHKERYYVPTATWTAIQSARAQGHKVLAVGTTSFRCVESFLRSGTQEAWGETDLFIYPQDRADIYRSSVFDGIMTNFHQPCSTLFMLISSLIGLETAQALYRTAVEHRYRLFSYGDASLLWF